MNRRILATVAATTVLAFSATACDSVGDAVNAADEAMVTEKISDISVPQQDSLDALSKTGSGLIALKEGGYTAIGLVKGEGNVYYVHYKACGDKTPEECAGNPLEVKKPDVHINLDGTLTDTKLKPSGTYSLAYPVGDKGLKYRYLCAMQGQPAASDQTTGLTKTIVGEFSAIGAVVIDAVDKAQTVKGNEWKCSNQLVAS